MQKKKKERKKRKKIRNKKCWIIQVNINVKNTATIDPNNITSKKTFT